jgi:alpha-methylacyl-CoA racemase
MGILLALIERNKSGRGQVVDAAMVDGAANLSTLFYGLMANHLMSLDIGTNVLDGGAPYYQVYETADGKYVAVGAIEGKFYAQLLEGLGLDPSSLPHQNDMQKWPEMKARFAQVFMTKTRNEWSAIFDTKDACVTPVLELNEAGEHPHNRERDLLVSIDGISEPAPAPRLSLTPGKVVQAGTPRGSHTGEILKELGYSEEMMEDLLGKEVIENTQPSARERGGSLTKLS